MCMLEELLSMGQKRWGFMFWMIDLFRKRIKSVLKDKVITQDSIISKQWSVCLKRIGYESSGGW
jgi:hypothetical protein